MINLRTESEFKEQIISRCTIILSPNGLNEGPVVVASAENTRRLTHVILMLADRHALWLNLQPALVNVSCYIITWTAGHFPHVGLMLPNRLYYWTNFK